MFDDTIQALRKWFEERKRLSRKISVSDDSGFPPSASEKSPGPAIILREDTHVELGHPSTGSCSLCVATHNELLVKDGTLTLCGPDIPEAAGSPLPFAQLVLASCKGDVGETSLAMDRIVHAASQTEGYMLRSVPNRVWARVSKEAARSGFTLEKLGSRLYAALMRQCPGVTGAEIFFVTSSREDVSSLERIIQPAREKLEKFQTYERLPDGTYECTTGLDCTECPEKPVCDNIREVITIRKGDRIITFGRDSDGRLTEKESGESA